MDAPSSAGRILIVDDHARNVAILEKILRSQYKLATAASGEEALALAPRFAPDLVLLDIMMPGIDGYETCRRLRAHPELAHTKIIMVSAKAMLSERLAGYEAGADDYMIKPFDEDELRSKVTVYMRLKTVEEADLVRNDLLMLLSQESRTPLENILKPLRKLLEDASLSREHQKALQNAEKEARSLNTFVDRLVHLNNVHAGKVRFRLERHDLSVLINQCVDRVRPVAQSVGVLIYEKVKGPVLVDFDEVQIRTVLDALLDNAVRVSPRPGNVTVKLSLDDGYACISVADPGGVADHFRPRPAAGVPTRQEANGDSQSLSLVTARAILRHQEGFLAAESGENGGAVFVLRLPVPQDETSSVPQRAAA